MNYITSKQLAAASGLKPARIRQLAPEMPAGMAGKIANRWVFEPGAVEWVSNREDNRGKYERKNLMQVEKIEEGKYQVSGAPIRGYDWQLIRETGGTYAVIAGEIDDADDEHIVIEEHEDDGHRALWDKKNVLECAGAAYRELKAITQDTKANG